MKLVVVSAGEGRGSKTRALVSQLVDERGGELIELWRLPAEGLLGRTDDHRVAAAVEAAAEADVLVVATPVYRATYTGALKAFFDRFPPGALAGTAVVLVATALAPEHYLSLDTGGRALIASLEGLTVPPVVYALAADFVDGRPGDEILIRLRAAVDQAEAIARSIS